MLSSHWWPSGCGQIVQVGIISPHDYIGNCLKLPISRTWAVTSTSLGTHYRLLVNITIIHMRVMVSWALRVFLEGSFQWRTVFTNRAARMSMIFSIIRITPPMLRLRTAANLTAALFALFWLGLMVQKLYICAHDTDWYHTPTMECHLGKSVVVLELCSESFNIKARFIMY